MKEKVREREGRTKERSEGGKPFMDFINEMWVTNEPASVQGYCTQDLLTLL